MTGSLPRRGSTLTEDECDLSARGTSSSTRSETEAVRIRQLPFFFSDTPCSAASANPLLAGFLADAGAERPNHCI